MYSDAMHSRGGWQVSFWKTLIANLQWIGMGLAAIIAAFISSRYSLLSKILESSDNRSKQADERNALADKHAADQQMRLDRLDSDLYAMRAANIEVQLQIVKYREENTELIRCNNILAINLSDMTAKYDALLIAHGQLQTEHDALKKQLHKLTDGSIVT